MTAVIWVKNHFLFHANEGFICAKTLMTVTKSGKKLNVLLSVHRISCINGVLVSATTGL